MSACLLLARCIAPARFITRQRFDEIPHKRLLLPAVVRSCLPSPDSDTESNKLKGDGGPSSSFSPSYSWCAAIGALGFAETSYLTYLKLTGSEVFCPIAGGACSTILNSDYASVFGIPLPVFGMVAYGFVTLLSLQLARRDSVFGLDETSSQLALLGSGTAMAAASSYFLYLLSSKFSGESCTYCLLSAFLSFSLFFITAKEFKFQEMQKTVGIQLSIVGLVIASLTTSHSGISSEVRGSSDIELLPFETEITTESSPQAISLARHLQKIGAKMYGAFWCSHCLEQKEMFGKEAAKNLNYVECFPNGYRKGVKPDKACQEADIEGFPTWVIKGQVLSGEQEFSELAEASGYIFEEVKP